MFPGRKSGQALGSRPRYLVRTGQTGQILVRRAAGHLPARIRDLSASSADRPVLR
jgi:hypothetical protein